MVAPSQMVVCPGFSRRLYLAVALTESRTPHRSCSVCADHLRDRSIAHLRPVRVASDHTSRNLVSFYCFEQGLEIPFTESLVAFALDDFEEYGPDHGVGEDLQEQIAGPAVDQ